MTESDNGKDDHNSSDGGGSDNGKDDKHNSDDGVTTARTMTITIVMTEKVIHTKKQ